jgi:lipopolysaccharide transport system permease protein
METAGTTLGSSQAATLTRAAGVVAHLVHEEYRLRYRRASLGWLWSVGQPLARLAVLSFVFTRLLPLDIPDYAVFLFTGLIGWSWFAAGVTSATRSAMERRHLLFRPSLPRAAIPPVSVLTDGMDYLAALPVLVGVMLVTGHGVPLSFAFLPVILLVQLALILGLGYALCAANVPYRDVHLLVGVVMLLGFYVTPIFYDVDRVPDRYRWIIDVNPVARLIEAQRDVVIEGTLPAAGPFLLLTVACAAVLLGGYAVYRRASPTFLDEL